MKDKWINKCFILFVIFMMTVSYVFSQSTTDPFKTITISNLVADGTQAKRYEIAKVGFNSYHWQAGGIIQIELIQKYFGIGYEKYYLELGYGQGTSSTLPRLRHIESAGPNRNAQIKLGASYDMGTSYAGYPNKTLPIYADIKFYSNYYVKISYFRNRVETLTEQNQISVNENPVGVNIIDFTVDKGASALNITEDGNLGLWNDSANRMLHIGTTIPGTSSDPEADFISSNGIIIGSGKMFSLDHNYFTHASMVYKTNIGLESRFVHQGYYGHAFTTRGDIPRLVILGDNGNVGIGATTPTQKLSITTSTDFDGINLTNSTQSPMIRLNSGNSNVLARNWGITTNHFQFGDFNISNSTTAGGGISTARLSISKDGNVGIGTTNPTEKLEVSGTIKISNGNSFRFGEGFQYITNDATNSKLIFGSNGGQNLVISNGNVGIGTITPNSRLEVVRSFRIASNTSGYGYEFFRSDDDTQMDLRYMASNSIHRQIMTFTYNGDVGIGTTTIPSNYKLAVAGNVIAEKVKVKKQSSGWPDFVFSPTYKLPNLTEVETFVKQNSHLPEIPSAAEIEKDGQDLGEMNRLLLKKVEELTLYMIEMKKENEKQNIEIEKLKLIKK